MSEAPTEPATIGDVVDATTTAVASETAAQVADSLPEPSSTTVVVEPDTKDTTATGLDAAAHMRQIAREEADRYMGDLIAYENERKAKETPEVVVIATPAPEPASAPAPEPSADTVPDPSPDEAPPMARSHPYFKPLGRKGKKS